MQALRLARVAILYPGDLGSAFGRALVQAGLRVSTFTAERSPRTQEAAARAGLHSCESFEAAVADADLVVSLVPPEQALATARRFGEALRAMGAPGAHARIYLDANSIAPATAREVAREVERAGAACVDGAFLGSAQDLRTRGSLLLSGGPAAELAQALAGAVAVRVVGAAVGDASAFKLCFASFNKSLVAMGLETLGAAARAGFAEPLLATLRDFYPGTLETLERLVPSYPRHLARRAQEMGQVSAWLAELGHASAMADAARVTFERVARAGLDGGRAWDLPELIEEIARRAPLSVTSEPRGATQESEPRAAGARGGPAPQPGPPWDPPAKGNSMTADQKPQSSELHPGPGFRIRQQISRPDPALIEAFRPFEGPMISDLMNRLYTMRPAIQNLTDRALAPLVGPACTVKVFPGDNLMVHAALDVARPGDVLVIDAGGSHMNAVLGDLVSNKAKHRGIAGIVVDGLVRDIDGIREARIPVFARGVTPVGPLHRGPGEINFPVQCGGIVVNPGDLIFADNNGVVVVPQEIAPELLKRCQEKTEKESAYVACVKRGQFSNAWVHVELATSGCHVIDAEG